MNCATVRESVARAARSGNLRQVLDRYCDADVITAMGWASRKNPLGVGLLRGRLTGDAVEIAAAVEEAQRYVRKLRARHPKCPEQRDDWWDKLAIAGAGYWLDPLCRACEGRGYLTIPGTPTLSATACYSCDGTTRRKTPKVGHHRTDRAPFDALFQAVVSHLDTLEDDAALQIKHLLTRTG